MGRSEERGRGHEGGSSAFSLTMEATLAAGAAAGAEAAVPSETLLFHLSRRSPATKEKQLASGGETDARHYGPLAQKVVARQAECGTSSEEEEEEGGVCRSAGANTMQTHSSNAINSITIEPA